MQEKHRISLSLSLLKKQSLSKAFLKKSSEQWFHWWILLFKEEITRLLQTLAENSEWGNIYQFVSWDQYISENKTRQRYYRKNKFHTNSTAAAAAKSLQSCPTLCDPIDSSPPSVSIPSHYLECDSFWYCGMGGLTYHNCTLLFSKYGSLTGNLLKMWILGLEPNSLF